MQLQEAISNRRSIRSFTDYFVTDDELKQITEAARWAPSWANTQVGSFIIVRDKNTINAIADVYSNTNPAKKCTASASAVIIACAKKGMSGCRDGMEVTQLKNWYMFDLGLAVQNICLKAHELGLGTVIVGLLDHGKLKNILSVPDNHEAVVAIPVGKPVDQERKIPGRKHLENMMFLDKFDNKF